MMSVLLAALLCSGCDAKVKEYKVKVVKEYPHATDSYTQGLFFHKGDMYESTGQYGSSTFRKVDLATGNALEKLDFNRKYFVEGSVVLGDNLYILTWESKVAFVYDANTLEYKSTYSYPREGWGLTTDGRQLIASDGSSRLYFLDGEYKLQRSVNVTLDGRPVRYLNELEYIDGKVWANVYTTDLIVIINPVTRFPQDLSHRKVLEASVRDRTRRKEIIRSISSINELIPHHCGINRLVSSVFTSEKG